MRTLAPSPPAISAATFLAFSRSTFQFVRPCNRRRSGTKMVEGIKTAVLRRYLLSLRFRGLPRRFHGNYYFRWKILRLMNQVPRASTDVVSQSNFSRWEKPSDLPPYFFLLPCFLESRENFGNYFVRAAYFSVTKRNCELAYLIRFPFQILSSFFQKYISFVFAFLVGFVSLCKVFFFYFRLIK